MRRAPRKQYSAEEKIRVVIEGLRGRLPASEKLEIVRSMERSHPGQAYLDHAWHLQTDVLSLPPQYQHRGEVGLEDRRSGPSRAWNRPPDTVREQIIDLALEQPELSQSHPG